MNREPQANGCEPRDSYVDIHGAAEYLSLSPRFLRGKLRSIPHYRVGSKLIFRLSELDQWIAQYREVGIERQPAGMDDLLAEARKKAESMIDSQGAKPDKN